GEVISAGETYRLEGTVSGGQIGATVRLPSGFSLTSPDLPRDTYLRGQAPTFEWSSMGVSGVRVQGQAFKQGQPSGVAGFSTGERLLFNGLLIPESDSLDLDFFALERGAAAFYDPTLDGGVGAKAGNISGAEGFFGGAIVAHRRLIAE
ncbi:MAG: hypothetical protein ACREL6_12360, partial [Gemmatimonadales bacterium]